MHIFAYGTLMYPELLMLLTGKTWLLEDAYLRNYRRYILLEPGFSESPIIVPSSDGQVMGKILFDVDTDTLALLDAYEGIEQNVYQRIASQAECCASHQMIPTQCYCIASPAIRYGGEWTPATFEKQHYETFKKKIIPEFLADYHQQ